MEINSKCADLKGNDSDVCVANISHKEKKAVLKKQKRKLKRQALARERDRILQKDEEKKKASPTYLIQQREEEEEEKSVILRLEDESRRQRELWEWSEEVYKERLKQKAELEERERLNRLEIERKIKEEWEKRQKQEKEEEEEKQKKKEKQEEMLRQARQGENKDGDWHNPLAPVQYGKDRVIEQCPFFIKVGACRFGDRCSRGHPYPEKGRTILFTNMFRHFQLDQGLCEEYDTDIVLEYEDSEVNQKFSEFYEDTLPEFKSIGRVIQFKVSCNFQPHLRGNVYVSYTREDEAMQAYTKFNARWYAGKQISGQFVDIPSWKRAICGLFGRGRCPKGRECNFLHVFKNPRGEFIEADRDMENSMLRQPNGWHGNRSDRQPYSRDRRSPFRSHRTRRSRSSDRTRSRRSRSRDRQYNYKDYRSSRYSRSKSRERSESSRKSRSTYRSKTHKQSRDRSESCERSRSRERARSREPSRSRSKERSRCDRSRERKKKHRHSQCRSPSVSGSRSLQKYKKSKRREKSNNSSSDEEKSDFEEVWVEKKNDRKPSNGT